MGTVLAGSKQVVIVSKDLACGPRGGTFAASTVLPDEGGGFMKFLVTTAVISIALLAAAPVASGSQSLSAQTEKPKEQPKPQPSTGAKAAPPTRPTVAKPARAASGWPAQATTKHR